MKPVPYYVAAVVVWVYLSIGGALPEQSNMNINNTDGHFVPPGQSGEAPPRTGCFITGSNPNC